ncbi:hypothetical protein AT50_00284 [Streptococcus equi subsp. zooepidemicus Sz105]|uniref:DUF2130 domain-containing protein n=1 Tax=Streptococcus equi TaxID=1336 RepID=UPI0005BBEDFE|nr:DUF2130 domain-containing protein [Streptococcus equi]KIS13182.1 hypothetical protein AT50_00284 [Streptococcus equi subsp. zooepidemicus Sz105]MDI5988593.1 DUF2130 domain-containing protein [Streptococcus equi subsp. zooepidemicus]HEL0558329.1 DUF2130 domain-containing protein [Streptococcus equi subsp. zooepidemicus]HEL0585080.1 DUF2130 domain-containing protein [Streptococcus equi subsp. zooepidemicus]HEL0608858.1 DUF2130 domain-containing protein [Streptococcus equi subsp. zooepidemicus
MKELKCPHCHTLFTVNESDYSQLLAQVRGQEFDKELAQRLESEMKLQEARANSRFQEVLTKKEQAIQSLTNRLERIEQEQAYLRQQELAQKDKELLELHNQLDKLELEQQSRLQSALTVVEKERDHLKNQLVLQEKESELSLASVRSDYEVQLKAVNEQVEFYKNFKAQQSTKAIGESLELYAETEFNKVRSYAFPNASFTKDNQVSHRGSKGDYIYRELDSNGVEILSIMFEMKNEADTTKTKHKNSDFFKELDKDRREKNCEYAVLVTMLEADNDYYNAGIVDVSHDYDKMYVVRPQLFIHLIGLLRNAALNSLKYKQELALVREQHIDITHFEEDLEQFKHAFAKNYQSASNNFKKAIDEIDKSIKRMEEIKRFLTTSENQLRLANNKLDDVSVKKLTRNNPTMRDKFQAIKP